MIYAIQKGKLDLVMLLHKHGVTLFNKEFVPIAVKLENKELLQYLITNGSPIDEKSAFKARLWGISIPIPRSSTESKKTIWKKKK